MRVYPRRGVSEADFAELSASLDTVIADLDAAELSLSALSDSLSEFASTKGEANGLASLDADEYLNEKIKYLRTIADPGSPTPGEIWINGADLKYRDNGGTPATRTLEVKSNKNASGGYAGLSPSQAIDIQDYTQQTVKSEVAWTSGVALTVETNIPATNGDYYVEVNYWIERIAGGANRRGGLWRFLARRTGGTLSILNSGDSGPIGPYTPTQAWGVSGDDFTWIITDASNSGQVAYFVRTFKCGDLTT